MISAQKKQDIKEKAIVMLAFIGFFLPVRILFYTYVSEHWLGSLGVISAIAFVITYLSHIDKFGKFGRLWKKQIKKIAVSKFGGLMIVSSIILIFMMSLILIGIEAGKSDPQFNKIVDALEETPLTFTPDNAQTFGDSIEQNAGLNISPDNVAAGFERLAEMDQEQALRFLSLAIALIDNRTAGFLQHFYIIFFFEEIERAALFIYFRWVYNRGKN